MKNLSQSNTESPRTKKESAQKKAEIISFFENKLSPLYNGIIIESNKVASNFFKLSNIDGKLVLTLDVSKVDEKRLSNYLIHIIGNIDIIKSLGKAANTITGEKEVKKMLINSRNGYYKFFYTFIYNLISVHRSNIAPAFRGLLSKNLALQKKSLERKYDPLPKHLQFLIGLAGDSVDDGEVKQVIADLEDAALISQLTDPRVQENTRLETIHSYIFPQYEYFLSLDKKNWKNKARKKDTIDEIVEKTKVDTEDIIEQEKQIKKDLEKDEDSKGKQEEKEPENDMSDYNPTYKTPEGGRFEKGNKKTTSIEVSPGLKGYYIVDQKSSFDSNTLLWTNRSKMRALSQNEAFSGQKYTMKFSFASDGLKSLPLPYHYTFDIENIRSTNGKNLKVFRDDNGAFFIENFGKNQVEIDFYQQANLLEIGPNPQDREALFTGSLSPKTMAELSNIASLQHPLEKARRLRDYIQSIHFYPPGKNQSETLQMAQKLQKHLQDISNGSNYIFNLDASTHLECYSANTLLVALLRHIGIPARMATGHHIQSIAANGSAYLTGSNGHGWTMIWDGNTWVRFDATPPKDPTDPRNKKDPKDKDSDDEDKESTEGESADDGGDDSEAGGDGGDGQEGEGKQSKGKSGKSGSKGKRQGQKKGQNTSDGGPDQDTEMSDSLEDNDQAFEDMYRELMEKLDREDASKGGKDRKKKGVSDEEDNELEELINQEAQEEKEKQNPSKSDEEIEEESLGTRYPTLTKGEIKDLSRFIKDFKKDLEKISQLENPLYRDGLSEDKTLEEALKHILDRIINRSIKKREIPRYPVVDGDILIDPVQLHLDTIQGVDESFVFQTTEILEEEELKIVKVRRRKILDASGSMDGSKLRTQQQIEVLENKVIAEKQKELELLSEQLGRDLRFETETWQFGTRNREGGYTLLKPMGSQFDELEQAAIWKLTANSLGGTNDFDPLIAIYKSLTEELKKEKKNSHSSITTLERIRTGFLVREINAYKELSSKETLTQREKVHLQNLTIRDTNKVKKILSTLIPEQTTQFFTSPEKNDMISKEEQDTIERSISAGKSVLEIFQDWLEVIKNNHPNIEPILEIIEISSDGGSDNSSLLKEILKTLRSFGIIIIGYGLGSDGKTVEKVYQNDFNPDEGGHHCINLLDFPRLKIQSWQTILDKI